MSTVITLPQQMQALGVANRRRSAVADTRRRVRQGQLTVLALIADPPAHLRRHLIWEVLLWTPGFGPAQLRALNVRALRHGHVNLAACLGSLTDRQRQWLSDQPAIRR